MQDPWHFVAMEYYALILNRTYRVAVDESSISGKVCRGLTAVEAGGGMTAYVTGKLAVHGDLNDPASYISDQYLARHGKVHFLYKHEEVTAVTFNPRKKWGMGPYPHDGRVTIVTGDKRRELIILGKQSGMQIAERISGAVARANPSFKPTLRRGA